MERIVKYKVNDKVTNDDLNKFGFTHGKYTTDVYKHLIKLSIFIDSNDKWWSYQVYDVNSNSLYAPFYQRSYGRNEIIKTIDKNIESIIKDMVSKKLLIPIKK